PGYRTDHSMISVEIKPTKLTRKKTFWKFNSRLLQDKEYINIVKETIRDVKIQYMPLVYDVEKLNEIEHFQPTISDQLFLEVLLMEIRAKTLKYSGLKKRLENKEEQELINEIEQLEKKTKQKTKTK
ncbi:MAG: hypothetical protein AAF549_09790, partial [Pseudomonadota bacterium]